MSDQYDYDDLHADGELDDLFFDEELEATDGMDELGSFDDDDNDDDVDVDAFDSFTLPRPSASSQPTQSATTAPAGNGLPEGIVDRRLGVDRRDLMAIAAKLKAEAGRLDDDEIEDDTNASADAEGSGLERRRGPGRRRSDFTKSAEEGEMTKEQFLFLMAIDGFKKANGCVFPTWSDVLEVIRLLGYRKTVASELRLGAAEDWSERHDAPHGVRVGASHLTQKSNVSDDANDRKAA